MDILIWTLITAIASSVILSWVLGLSSISIKKKYLAIDIDEKLNQRRFKEKEFNINSKVDSEIELELDKFVSECVNEYILINYSHTNNYLNAEECDKLLKDVVEMIKKRLTTTMYDKMTLYYNKQDIGTVIVNKAYFYVMKFIMERNNKVTF